MRRAAWLILSGVPLVGCPSTATSGSELAVPATAPAAATDADDVDAIFNPPPFENPTPEQLHETSRRAIRTLIPYAAKGQEWALAILNENYNKYPISSLERADIAAVFGYARYTPAARNLADSVGAASMNLGWAAHVSLCQIFPDAAREFPDPEAAADYWIDYVKTHRGGRAYR
jgi:hypothetical protein